MEDEKKATGATSQGKIVLRRTSLSARTPGEWLVSAGPRGAPERSLARVRLVKPRHVGGVVRSGLPALDRRRESGAFDQKPARGCVVAGTPGRD